LALRATLRKQDFLGPSYGLVGRGRLVVSWVSRFNADKIIMSISTIKTFIWRSNFVWSSKLGLGDSLSLFTSESNWFPNNWNRSGVLGKIGYPASSDFWPKEGWPFPELKPE
jgi:hypothetical protein